MNEQDDRNQFWLKHRTDMRDDLKEQSEPVRMTPEDADTIVNNLAITMIREGYGPEIITLVRDHLRATLEPLVRVHQTGEMT